MNRFTRSGQVLILLLFTTAITPAQGIDHTWGIRASIMALTEPTTLPGSPVGEDKNEIAV